MKQFHKATKAEIRREIRKQLRRAEMDIPERRTRRAQLRAQLGITKAGAR